MHDTTALSRPKHRQAQPLAANSHVELDLVTRAWEQKVPPCLLKAWRHCIYRVHRRGRGALIEPQEEGGVREVLNLQRFPNAGALACHELGWRPHPPRRGRCCRKGPTYGAQCTRRETARARGKWHFGARDFGPGGHARTHLLLTAAFGVCGVWLRAAGCGVSTCSPNYTDLRPPNRAP